MQEKLNATQRLVQLTGWCVLCVVLWSVHFVVRYEAWRRCVGRSAAWWIGSESSEGVRLKRWWKPSRLHGVTSQKAIVSYWKSFVRTGGERTWWGRWNGKGKVCPITCHEDTEAEWRYSSTLSLASVLERWVVNATPRPLYPPTLSLYQLYGRLGGPWTCAENLDSTGIRSPDHPARSGSLSRLSYRGAPCWGRGAKCIWCGFLGFRGCCWPYGFWYRVGSEVDTGGSEDCVTFVCRVTELGSGARGSDWKRMLRQHVSPKRRDNITLLLRRLSYEHLRFFRDFCRVKKYKN
jgi:hypothetical protein